MGKGRRRRQDPACFYIILSDLTALERACASMSRAPGASLAGAESSCSMSLFSRGPA